jgi:hypothetical protein
VKLPFLTRSSDKAAAPTFWDKPAAAPAKKVRSYLVGIAVATVALWQIPLGRLLLYPVTLLATWFHEMGHGLASMLLGASFERLMIFGDASGYALSRWPADTPGLFHALTAAAGLLGPALAGAAMIVAARSERATRIVLYALAAALALSTLIWVRSLVGWIALPGLALAVFVVAASKRAQLRRFVIEFLGVQAAISLWLNLGYLFSEGATVGGQTSLSDTGAIASVLLLPYWFWGGAISVATAAILWKALAIANRP